ncbi:MAG: T9SS type A sorting domain-containing protein [Melioribacter sp.]|nr:T9SS type A sorting domain-containing protein [Melioribacter sp.]
MKVKYFIFLLVVSLSSFLNGQNIITNKLAEENAQNGEGSIIDARPVLERLSKAAGIDLDKIEPIPPQLRKTAWTFNVGSPGPYSNGWWAHDLSGSTIGFYTTPATCRAVGTNCYIFVENTVWDNGRVNQNAVNKVMEAFDTKNALPNSTKGIYQTNVEYFGNPPNVDNDPRIIILILDIKDNYATNPSEGYTAGYFYSYNQGNASNSNKAEVFYLDANPLNLTTDAGIYSGMSITAHEFQHMIHWNYTPPSSQTFFNESFSEIASYLNGYNLRSTSLYSNSTNVYTIGWNSTLTDYARAARFSLYLYEQFSGGIFKQYVQNRIFDENGIKFAAQAFDPGRDFESILEDWFIANYLNNRNYNTRYGYQLANQTKAASTVYINPNVNNTFSGVSKYGVQYITYKGGKNLTINFNSNGNASLKVKAIKIGSSNIQVENVPTNTNVNFSDYGTTFTEITFAVYVADKNAFIANPSTDKFSFSYNSTGTAVAQTFEIAYDATEPTGYLQLTPGDSVAVWFEAMSGMKIDSIKVALRGTLPIQGRVLEYLGLSNRLGGGLMASITATPTLASPPAVINSGADYPYQIPYPNWVKVDLRSFNLTADKSFAVQFPIGAAYPSTNRVMSTYYQSSASYYSFSYQSTNSPPRWIYYSVSGKDGYIFLFLIRAYVSSVVSNVSEPIEILPSAFALDQNYPNPFNPETVISFSLPKSSNVQIKIYDVLGNEIRTLINEERIAGKHNIYWNATDNSGKRVSSGVYFYTISADNFTQTKKMVLMK